MANGWGDRFRKGWPSMGDIITLNPNWTAIADAEWRKRQEEEGMASYEHEWADDIIRLCDEYGVGVGHTGAVGRLKQAIEDRTADLIRRSVPPPAVPESVRDKAEWSPGKLRNEKSLYDRFGGVPRDEGVRCCDECAKPLIAGERAGKFYDYKCLTKWRKRKWRKRNV